MIYVVGFAMDVARRHTLLVEKVRPDWQAGRLNGIGCKVNDVESAQDAMRRSFRAATRGQFVGSILYERHGWKHFAQLIGDTWQCACFAGFHLAYEDMMKLDGSMTDEKERLQSIDLHHIGDRRLLPNVRWMLPFIACAFNEYSSEHLPLVFSERTKGAIMASGRSA